MSKSYSYVGPKNIYDSARAIFRVQIISSSDISYWIKESQQTFTNSITATYIIDTQKKLWIADRHHEHVACAQRENVLAAGEITFTKEKNDFEIPYISNQSTGYCPEPECWNIVEEVLKEINLKYPDYFSLALIFRRCLHCKQINIVKDNIFECAVCEKELDLHWNLA